MANAAVRRGRIAAKGSTLRRASLWLAFALLVLPVGAVTGVADVADSKRVAGTPCRNYLEFDDLWRGFYAAGATHTAQYLAGLHAFRAQQWRDHAIGEEDKDKMVGASWFATCEQTWADKFKSFGDIDPPEIGAQLERICRRNPDKDIFEALALVLEERFAKE